MGGGYMEKVKSIQRKLLVSTLLVIAALAAFVAGGAFAASSGQVKGTEQIGFFASLGAPVLILVLLVLPRTLQVSSRVTALAAAIEGGDGRFDRGEAVDSSAALLTKGLIIASLSVIPGVMTAHGFWGFDKNTFFEQSFQDGIAYIDFF